MIAILRRGEVKLYFQIGFVTKTRIYTDYNRRRSKSLIRKYFPSNRFQQLCKMKDLVIVRKCTMSNDFYRKSGRAIEDFTFDDNYSG